MKPEPETDLDHLVYGKLDKCLRLMREGVTHAIAIKRFGLIDFIKSKTPLATWFCLEKDMLDEELVVVAERRLYTILNTSEDDEVVARVGLGIRDRYFANQEFNAKHALDTQKSANEALFNTEVVGMLKAMMDNKQPTNVLVNMVLAADTPEKTLERIIPVPEESKRLSANKVLEASEIFAGEDTKVLTIPSGLDDIL